MVDTLKNNWNQLQELIFAWYEALGRTTLALSPAIHAHQ
jgi:hypothetical protein